MTNAEYQQYQVARQQMLQKFKTDFLQKIRGRQRQVQTRPPSTQSNKRTYSTMAENDSDAAYEELTPDDMHIFQSVSDANADCDDEDDPEDEARDDDYEGVINGASC